MRRWLSLLLWFLWIVPSLSIAPIIAIDEKPQPQNGITHVLVISMDGVRPDAVQQIAAPVLLSLADSGAVDWDAQTVYPPVTVPAHASIFTGLDVEEHGIDHNDYTTERLGIPSFLSVAAEAGWRTSMIVGKNKLDQFHYPVELVDYFFAELGDRSVVDAAIERLQAGYEILFVHFPNPDYFGHSRGWMSESYLFELGNSDFQLGRLLDALDELGIADTTLILLTSDHGGHGTVHGADIPEDMNVPLIVAGPGVIPGAQLEDATVTQVTPTVLWQLNLPPAEGMAAPLRTAFE